MAKTHFKGMEVNTNGNLPKIGDLAPDFTLVKADLSEQKLSELKGKRVVVNIFPSIDTGVCATSVRKFNSEAANMHNTVVLCVSKDLPFAQGRFCGAENLNNVITLSSFRNPEFESSYGVALIDGPLKGLLTRAVVVVDENGKVVVSQLVGEITEEPDYKAVVDVLK